MAQRGRPPKVSRLQHVEFVDASNTRMLHERVKPLLQVGYRLLSVQCVNTNYYFATLTMEKERGEKETAGAGT